MDLIPTTQGSVIGLLIQEARNLNAPHAEARRAAYREYFDAKKSLEETQQKEDVLERAEFGLRYSHLMPKVKGMSGRIGDVVLLLKFQFPRTMTEQEICDRLNLSQPYVNTLLNKALDCGWIERDGYHPYYYRG